MNDKTKEELMSELGLLRAMARNLYFALDVMTKIVDYNSLDSDGDIEAAEEAMHNFSHYWMTK